MTGDRPLDPASDPSDLSHPGYPSPIRLVLATANPNKAAEISAILQDIGGDRFELLPRPIDVPDVDETGTTLEENALLKARTLAEATGLPAVADDTGLEVAVLDGSPGVYSARFAGEDATNVENVAKLLGDLTALGAVTPEQRRARFRTVAAVAYPDGSELLTDGTVEGVIIDIPRGDGGFGYDSVFAADEAGGPTFGELTSEEKHHISHRGRAFRALAARLSEQ
jgi:XTP/dITP diphosphohydrolase